MDGNVEQRFRVLVYERRKTNGLLRTLQDEFGDAVAAVDVVQGYDLCFAAPLAPLAGEAGAAVLAPNAGAAPLAGEAGAAPNAWAAPLAGEAGAAPNAWAAPLAGEAGAAPLAPNAWVAGVAPLAGEAGQSEIEDFVRLHLADPVLTHYWLWRFEEGEHCKNEPPKPLWPESLSAAVLGSNKQGNLVHLAYQSLAAQFDPRAQAVEDCWKLWACGGTEQLLSVRCFSLFLLQAGTLLPTIHEYLWMPLEQEVKDLRQFAYSARAAQPQKTEPPPRSSLLCLQANELRGWADEMGLRFDDATLAYIHAYYSGQKLDKLSRIAQVREPSLLELRILEAYWSDHCRHHTFHTELEWPRELQEDTGTIPKELCEAYRLYRELRCGQGDSPECLMDIAVLGPKALTLPQSYMDAVESSAEVNACSVFVDVEDAAGAVHRRLLLFKNETHNHPTEIEPYGGAATCLGGAIRDPLSGRSFVYQALRVSGAAGPQERVRAKRWLRVLRALRRSGKLPQSRIAREAARGFSDYGNRIGLSCNLVWEFYHPGFAAKRLECGMVVGVADPEQVRRLEPRPGDWLVLLGGATGRDGLGGASGSSLAHSNDTAAQNGAEVQRGNPLEERKLQRFFRRRDVGYMIRRCNDFGAGGLAVAAGEIADGLQLNLAAMPTKYLGLQPAELALSESQERMLVVLAAADGPHFCQKAAEEGIAAVPLGEVSQQQSFRLCYGSELLAELPRDFLDSGGPKRRARVRFAKNALEPYSDSLLGGAVHPKDWAESWENALCEILSSPQVASQRGLQQLFDSSVGSLTLFQPYSRCMPDCLSGDPTQEFSYNRSEVSAQLIPLKFWSDEVAGRAAALEGSESRTASVCSFAYDAALASSNCFFAAQVAIVQSVARLLAAGVRRKNCYLSLQEYFPKLESPGALGRGRRIAVRGLAGPVQAGRCGYRRQRQHERQF